MLEYIRNSAQSFGVKVAFGVIILVFVFWGVGNFNDRDYSNVVAVVNGEPILAVEFEKAYRSAEEYMLRNNPGLTRQELISHHLGRQVLRDLIQDTLVAQEASRAGIAVSPVELRQAAAKVPAFQDEKGHFDPEAYKASLAAQRIPIAEYEKNLAASLLRQKIQGYIAAAVWVDPEEAGYLFNYLRERRGIDYIFMPAARFTDKATVSEAEAKTWYDSHLDDFAIPAKVDVEYIAVRPENLVDRKDIGEARARAWYEANQQRFETPEEIRVAHILIPVGPDASAEDLESARKRLAEARAELESGKPFAAVADEFNPEGAAGAGGEIGWAKRGSLVPAFEEAAFALEPGKIGEAQTPFGLHLILLEEKRGGGARPFAAVENEVYAALAAEDGADKIQDVLDSLIEDNILQKPLAESAARFGLTAVRSGLLSEKELPSRLGINEDGAKALMALGANMPLDVPLEAGEQYVVARVVAATPAGTRPFAEVRGEVDAKLQAAKALSLDMAAANELLAEIKKGAVSAEQLQQDGLKSGLVVDRAGPVGGFTPAAELNGAIFAAAAGQWLDRAWQVATPDGQGALLVRVEQILPPDAGEFAGMEEIMQAGARRARAEALYDLFSNYLLNRAKVEITNQNLVDRVNM